MNYKYRVHDPRLGRFLSIDPLAASYPHNSPYAFSENRVIDAVELEGLESFIYIYKWNEENQGYNPPLKLGLVTPLPDQGIIHRFVGGPYIPEGYDRRDKFVPGSLSPVAAYDIYVKSAGRIISEFTPYVKVTNTMSRPAMIEVKNKPIGFKTGVEYILDKSSFKWGVNGLTPSNSGGYINKTVGANVGFGVLKFDYTQSTNGDEGVKDYFGPYLIIQGTKKEDGTATTEIYFQFELWKKDTGPIQQKGTLQIGIERSGEAFIQVKL